MQAHVTAVAVTPVGGHGLCGELIFHGQGATPSNGQRLLSSRSPEGATMVLHIAEATAPFGRCLNTGDRVEYWEPVHQVFDRCRGNRSGGRPNVRSWG